MKCTAWILAVAVVFGAVLMMAPETWAGDLDICKNVNLDKSNQAAKIIFDAICQFLTIVVELIKAIINAVVEAIGDIFKK